MIHLKSYDCHKLQEKQKCSYRVNSNLVSKLNQISMEIILFDMAKQILIDDSLCSPV